ncbi:MAG TPA: hypothetical protein VIU63_11655, partial [Nitrospira sp.]
AVRSRLLQNLNQKGLAHKEQSPAWLSWFRQPANLALAGGLTAAAFAVVLGTKIYQDSLTRHAQSVATEETAPLPQSESPPDAASPSTPLHATEPQPQPEQQQAPREVASPKKRALKDKAPSISEHTGDALKQRSESDQTPRQHDVQSGMASRSMKDTPTRAARHDEAAPSSTIPAPKPQQAPAVSNLGASVPAVSARALFYGGDFPYPDPQAVAPEMERRSPSLTEGLRANRPERKTEQFAAVGKAARPDSTLKPLGLRYSFVISGTDGQEREIDLETALKSGAQPMLRIQVNQDAYLQIWRTAESARPQLLFPGKDTGQTSLKMTAAQGQMIPLPTDSKTVTIRLSQAQLGPLTREEIIMLDRLSSQQLIESGTAGEASGSQERATYVVARDSSLTAQIAVNISLR